MSDEARIRAALALPVAASICIKQFDFGRRVGAAVTMPDGWSFSAKASAGGSWLSEIIVLLRAKLDSADDLRIEDARQRQRQQQNRRDW